MVRKQRWAVSCLAVLTALTIAMPPEVPAQVAGQHAGEISRVIPVVGIQRASQALAAAAKTPVLWEDIVNTQANARARVALDDGSVLNIGSDSSVHIVKHDAGAQQTELELTYGRLRSQAAKIAKPAGKFQVRTPAGVAGVVGTDFFLVYLNGVMRLIVFDGVVRFCNFTGQCVDVSGGQTSSVRANGTEPPLPPEPATPQMLTDAGQSTLLGKNGGGEGGTHHLSGWQIVAIAGAIVVPAVVLPLALRNDKTSAPPQQPGQPCVPVPGKPCP